MKSKLAIQIGLILLLLIPGTQRAVPQQKTEAEFKLVEFQMALYKRPPENDPNSAKAAPQALKEQHVAYVMSLLESGKAVIAGPLAEDGEIRGVAIFKTKTADEAKSLVDADPMVKAGYMTVEMHPWWSEEVMKAPTKPIKMTTAYLGFLVRGEKWTAEKTPQTEELQKAHLANINRLAEMKKLVVAGPFGDNGQLRGIFVFKVNSLAEAKSLAETDPAVQAGRLAIQMHSWRVPEGVLP
jgi:uncharacterized protein YciI